MATLMINTGPVAADSEGSRFGGVPLAPEGFSWPTCEGCSGEQRFLAQIAIDPADPTAGSLLVFHCETNPGGCSSWEALSGRNAVHLVRGALQPLQPGSEQATRLSFVAGVSLVEEPGDYDSARTSWGARNRRRDALGQFGGTPSWLQDEEDQTCSSCGVPMQFIAQLEEGPDHKTAINFGGGCGYAFLCRTCGNGAFLWQC